MIDFKKSLFQVTKTQKMNIIKHSKNKYRTDDSSKIWIGHYFKFVVNNKANEEHKILHITSR